jgi:hypothetical protein
VPLPAVVPLVPLLEAFVPAREAPVDVRFDEVEVVELAL